MVDSSLILTLSSERISAPRSNPRWSILKPAWDLYYL